MDIGRFNDRFVYVAAFGAFTDVAYDTPQQFKNMFGHLAYLMEGIARLGNLKGYEVSVEHDGGVVEGVYLRHGEQHRLRGRTHRPAADTVALDDGLLEGVVLVVRMPKEPCGVSRPPSAP